MDRLTSTEASRNFSEVLNRVAKGERFEVVRNGAAVAMIIPARQSFISAEQFRRLLATAPPVDDGFGADVREMRQQTPTPEPSWPS